MAKRKPIALLPAPEAAEVMKSEPTRGYPVVLESPHDAAPPLHEGWTKVPGSSSDVAKWEQELRLSLRDARNKLIHEFLMEGSPVWYKPTEQSMWPVVHSPDACTSHPIQAVTAKGGISKFQNKASDSHT